MSSIATVPPPFQVGVPIPSLIWSTFEDALRINIKRLAKDISSTLGQPDAPLMNAIFKDGVANIRPYIFEESDDTREVDMRCNFMCQRPDAPLFLQACGQPVVWAAAAAPSPSCARCAEHLYSKPVKLTVYLPVLKPLDTRNMDIDDKLFYDKNGAVYDAEYRPRGTYNPLKKKLILFDIDTVPI